MSLNLRDPLTLIVSAAAFGLVLSLWFAALMIWQGRRSKRKGQLEQRLGIGADALGSPPWSPDGNIASGRVLRLWRDGTQVTTIVPGQAPNLAARLERVRADAGFAATLRTLLIILGALFVAAFVLGVSISGSALIAGGIAAAFLQVVWILVNRRITRRHNAFAQQFMDALELAARSLRVGHPLVGSFELIAKEVPAPVGTVFAEIVQQQSLGMPLDQALRYAADKSASPDLKFFATAVVIQIRSGGNLADMMDRLAAVLRDRMRLSRRVRVLTAQTQFSKRVLLALPLLTFAALSLINPEYMSVLWTTTVGHIVLVCAGSGLVLGGWMMNMLAKQKA